MNRLCSFEHYHREVWYASSRSSLSMEKFQRNDLVSEKIILSNWNHLYYIHTKEGSSKTSGRAQILDDVNELVLHAKSEDYHWSNYSIQKQKILPVFIDTFGTFDSASFVVNELTDTSNDQQETNSGAGAIQLSFRTIGLTGRLDKVPFTISSGVYVRHTFKKSCCELEA